MAEASASVVIPAYFSHEVIGDCLRALERQQLAPLEVIVVNSSPEQDTRAAVAAALPAARFIQSPTRLLPHAARNLGLAEARGDVLVCTDPDCRAAPDWLARLLEALDAGHALVGGAIASAPDSPPRARAIHRCKFHASLAGLAAGPRDHLATANLAMTRRTWQNMGPFDARYFCGDTLFAWRCRAAGTLPWFEPRAVVWHAERDPGRSFVSERLSRGREFGAARCQFERWPRGRAAAAALGAPLIAALLAARTLHSCRRAGERRAWPQTIAYALLGQATWALGEGRAYAEWAARRP
jgi:GT2 family glycosyltransferase